MSSMRNLMNIVEGRATTKPVLAESQMLAEGFDVKKIFGEIPAAVRKAAKGMLAKAAKEKPEEFKAQVQKAIMAVAKNKPSPEEAAAAAEKIRARVAGVAITEAKKPYVPMDSRRYFGDKLLGDKNVEAIGQLGDDAARTFNPIKAYGAMLGGMGWITLNMFDPTWWRDNLKQKPIMTLVWAFNYWTIVQLIAWVGFDVDLGWLNNLASAYSEWRLYGTPILDANWDDISWHTGQPYGN